MAEANAEKSLSVFTVSHPKFGLGGAELQSYYLASEFARRGWRVTFLAYDRGAPVIDLPDNGVKLLLVKESSSVLINAFRTLRALFSVRSSVTYYRNVSHVLFLVRVAAKFTGGRYAWAAMHDERTGRHAASTVLRKGLESRSGLRRALGNLSAHIQDWLFLAGVRGAHWAFVQNRRQQGLVLSEMGRPADIVYNAHPIAGGAKEREPIIAFVAVFKDFKRPELFCQLASRFAGSGYRFVIVGENFPDAEQRQELAALMAESGVEYLGPRSPDEVGELLSRARLLANTSTAEGFPNTFIQAWMRGVPVVSLVVDPDEIISRHGLGTACDGSAEALASAVEKFMDNQELWEEHSRRCRAFAVENCNVERTVERLEKVFLEGGD